MQDEDLWRLGAGVAAGLAVVLALFGFLLAASVMLGTVIVVSAARRAKYRVPNAKLQEIEDYANRKDGDAA